MADHLEMVILGDGIAGRAMALALAQSGMASTIIAPKDTPPLLGGIQLAPNGWAALETLGLTAAAEKIAQPLAMMRLLSADSGNTLVEIDLTPTRRRPYASLPRQGLSDLLGKAAKATKLVTWKSGEGTALATQPDHVVLTLKGVKAPLTARHLIGADGAHGLGRQFVQAEENPIQKPAPRSAFRCVIPLNDLPPSLAAKSTSVWLGDGGHMVFYPLSSGHLNLVAVTTAGTSAQRQAQALVKSQPLLQPLAPYLAAATQLPLHRHSTLDVLRRGNVILAGDAAHPMPPHLAQGAGQSLIDASLMKTMLAEASDLNAIITPWCVQRIKATKMVMEKADRAGKIFALDGPLTHLRNIGLATFGGPAMARELDRIWQS